MMTQSPILSRNYSGAIEAGTPARVVLPGVQVILAIPVIVIQEATITPLGTRVATLEMEGRTDSPTFLALEMAGVQTATQTIAILGITQLEMVEIKAQTGFQTSLISLAFLALEVAAVLRGMQGTVEAVQEIMLGPAVKDGLPILHSSNFYKAKESIHLIVANF